MILKFSIITVCYNSVATLEQTIQSVIQQKFIDLEYIIIDGGSTDGTLNIIKKYNQYISRWISEPDNGIYDAMNKGIRLSTGDIIAFINSNDWYAEDTLQKVDTFFQYHDFDWVHGDMMTVRLDGSAYLIKGENPLKKDNITRWYEHPTVFVKRILFERYGLFDLKYKILADGDFMLRLRMHNIIAGYIPSVLAFFRLGGLSNSFVNMWIILRERHRIYQNLRNHFINNMEMLMTLDRTERRIRCEYRIKYLTGRMIRSNLLNKYLLAVLEKYQKKTFIVWGTGADGVLSLQYFLEQHLMVSGFIDSNQEKQKEKFYGFSVFSPVRYNKTQLLIIATRDYYIDIKNQMENHGFVHKKDFLSYVEFQEEITAMYSQSFVEKIEMQVVF